MMTSGDELKRLNNDTRLVGATTSEQKRLLSGLLKCGLCGGGMTIHRGDRNYCSARREKGTCKADCGIAATEAENFCRLVSRSYSGVSNIGYIWSLEERSYEAWAVLEID